MFFLASAKDRKRFHRIAAEHESHVLKYVLRYKVWGGNELDL